MVKDLAECRDVYDLLVCNVRPRPGMWARGGSLQELEAILFGYSVALEVHSMPEEFAFGARGAFTQWLESTYGWGMSLGWAVAIEQHLQDGETPMDAFFRLLDEYRATSNKSADHTGPFTRANVRVVAGLRR
ncbi:hypothetical protein AB0L82_35725 [Nocardia sp. NPDC052001]|uniref:hypothetical protein n=1 Tax=Nocardia sp. NPDC052001 TaxID=3154853 RepID=UPI00343858C3